MVKCCGTCLAYNAMSQQCRRESPKVFVIGVNPKTGPITFSAWPPASAQDPGCMQYERDENAVEPVPGGVGEAG
jgi:hypothetical protein